MRQTLARICHKFAQGKPHPKNVGEGAGTLPKLNSDFTASVLVMYHELSVNILYLINSWQ